MGWKSVLFLPDAPDVEPSSNCRIVRRIRPMSYPRYVISGTKCSSKPSVRSGWVGERRDARSTGRHGMDCVADSPLGTHFVMREAKR